jgi:hypothetical protein
VDLAVEQLAQEPLDSIAGRSGFECLDDTHTGEALRVPFLNRVYRVAYPAFIFTDEMDDSAEIPLQEQVLILHYIQQCQPRLNGNWIAYREIPGAGFYFGAFLKRAVEPFKKVFGSNAAGFERAAVRLQATPVETGSRGYEFRVLPFAPLQIILWEGDDEFPAEANILFDDTAGSYLSPEDAAWLASLTVYRLMALSS